MKKAAIAVIGAVILFAGGLGFAILTNLLWTSDYYFAGIVSAVFGITFFIVGSVDIFAYSMGYQRIKN